MITLPGSKSISNRVLLLATLAQGTTEIHDVLLSDDTERMLVHCARLVSVSNSWSRCVPRDRLQWKLSGQTGQTVSRQCE